MHTTTTKRVQTSGEKHPYGFYAPMYQGIFAHRKVMGMAVWEFMVLVHWVTEEHDDPADPDKKLGVVLGGSAVRLSTIAEQMPGVSVRQVRRNVDLLVAKNYIERVRMEGDAYRYVVKRSKKWAGKKARAAAVPAPAEVFDTAATSGQICPGVWTDMARGVDISVHCNKEENKKNKREQDPRSSRTRDDGPAQRPEERGGNALDGAIAPPPPKKPPQAACACGHDCERQEPQNRVVDAAGCVVDGRVQGGAEHPVGDHGEDREERAASALEHGERAPMPPAAAQSLHDARASEVRADGARAGENLQSSAGAGARAAVGDPSCTAAARRARVKRRERVRDMIVSRYERENGTECPWGAHEERQLRLLLRATLPWSEPLYAQCLDHRYRSHGVAKGASPREFLVRLPRFLAGPLDCYGVQLQCGGAGEHACVESPARAPQPARPGKKARGGEQGRGGGQRASGEGKRRAAEAAERPNPAAVGMSMNHVRDETHCRRCQREYGYGRRLAELRARGLANGYHGLYCSDACHDSDEEMVAYEQRRRQQAEARGKSPPRRA